MRHTSPQQPHPVRAPGKHSQIHHSHTQHAPTPKVNELVKELTSRMGIGPLYTARVGRQQLALFSLKQTVFLKQNSEIVSQVKGDI